jgi:hypothetical protein
VRVRRLPHGNCISFRSVSAYSPCTAYTPRLVEQVSDALPEASRARAKKGRLTNTLPQPPSHTAQLTHTPYSSTRHQHRMLDKSPSFPAHMHLPESSAEGRTAQLWEVATVPRSDEHERRVRHVSGLLTASALRTWHQIQHLGGPRPDGNFSFGCPSKKPRVQSSAIFFRSDTHRPNRQKWSRSDQKTVRGAPRSGHPPDPSDALESYTAWLATESPCTSVQPAGKLPRCIRHPDPPMGDPRLILRRALVRRTRSCRGQFFILHLFDPIGVLFPRR